MKKWKGSVLTLEWMIMAQAMFDIKDSTVKMWLHEGYQNHDVLIICYFCWMFDSRGYIKVVGNMKNLLRLCCLIVLGSLFSA